ncbi:MAG: DNA repair protein RadA [Bacteroidales bacterium]|nr:DNA repair protein RadA [Bacteroidales bacterium]
MAKSKIAFVCQNCGAHSPKWMGKCTSCGAWNSFQEEVIESSVGKSSSSVVSSSVKPMILSEIKTEKLERILTGIHELDQVVGGGIVPGSVVLLGGEPGIGKSTLLLQVAVRLNKKVLYVSGEESPQQIYLRAQRLNVPTNQCYIYSETNVAAVIQEIKDCNPDLVIVDSVQTLKHPDIDASPGSVSQIRETSNLLIELAKQRHIPMILIGHINKEGSIAGPKILEHMVDVVLQFEGDMQNVYRILRSNKNRFGSTAEIGIFEMVQNGLREVANPSEILLSGNPEKLSGVAVASVMEGIRPLMIEVQALVSTAAYGTPQRTVNGYDAKRLNMLLAVIEKRLGVKIYTKDVFINIAGGIRVQDTSIDFAVVAAILSSLFDFYIPTTYCFAGEIGLTGEIRSVSQVEKRIKESMKLGIRKMFVPTCDIKSSTQCEVIPCSRIDKTFREIFKTQKQE